MESRPPVTGGKRSYVADDAGEHLRFRCHQVIRSGPKSRVWI